MMLQVVEAGNGVAIDPQELAVAAARLPRSDAAVERALADCIVRARAAWPGIVVPLLEYADFIVERLDDAADVGTALTRLRADDLWIACACVRGDATAVRALDARWGGMLHASVASVVREGDIAADAVQHVRARLLLGTDGAPRIAGYRGRGDLEAWLRAAAIRQAIDLVRKQRPTQAFEDGGLSAIAIEDDPELTFLKHSYREQFRAAFDAAFAELDRRGRNLLRIKYLDGASIDVVARLYRVHRSTASRWLVDLRQQLMASTRARMEAELGLPPAEFASVVRMIASQLDLSLEGKLRTSGDDE